MSNAKLTPTSYLVLGLVGLLGQATSYDLKLLVARSIGYFWTFPHSQLYAEPERLVGMGLLTERRESGGRRRRVYSITDAGRKELDAWLRDPETDPPELRDMATLKLFFGNVVPPEDVRRLAERQIEKSEQRLAEYTEIEEQYRDVTGLDFQLATLRCGIGVERSILEFWKGIAANPPGSPSRSSPRVG